MISLQTLVRTARAILDQNLHEFAATTGVSATTIQRIEKTGQARLGTAQRLLDGINAQGIFYSVDSDGTQTFTVKPR